MAKQKKLSGAETSPQVAAQISVSDVPDKPRGRSRGSKLSRSEIVTVRLDPKLHYLAGLAARKQRRTLSSFFEWVLEDALKRISITEQQNDSRTFHEVASILWDVDEADRFVNLALNIPELLTHEEQVLWKQICEDGHFWRIRNDSQGNKTWRISKDALMIKEVRKHWGELNALAKGSAISPKSSSWGSW